MAATFCPQNVRTATTITLNHVVSEIVAEGALRVEVQGAGAYTQAVDNREQGTEQWAPAPVGGVDLTAGQCRAWRWMGGTQVPLRIAPP